MELSKVKYIHFIGIGGIGMSALARYFNHLKYTISGYDKTSTDLTKQLQNEGILIYHEENTDLIPVEIRNGPNSEEVLVIYTPAIPAKFAEVQYFMNNSTHLYKRAEVLGNISKSLTTIAVAGTHGKTTTTSFLAMLMLQSDLDFVAFVGGINENFDSNLIMQGEPKFMLTEADEYDRSFLHLTPSKAILTSIDADHLDIYGDEKSMIEAFTLFCESVSEDLWISEKAITNLHNINGHSYGLSVNAEVHAENIVSEGNKLTFDYVDAKTRIPDLPLNIPGYHNLENCLSAIAVALDLGVSKQNISIALSNYKGVKRRFEYHINRDDLIYIDDYAHHPSEIDAVVSSIRRMYPEKKITGIFQPHLFSRTRDFAQEFADSLEKLDGLLLLDIYPARELPIPGIDSNWLLNKIKLEDKKLCSKSELIDQLSEKHHDIILTIGAGDIDQMVVKIKNRFNKS